MMQRRHLRTLFVKGLLGLGTSLFLSQVTFSQVALKVETPMSPPAWALMERALLESNSRAVEAFAEKYMDERGYLLHTPRWGTLDGPDDAIETYFNWTLLHAFGGSDKVLDLYRKGMEGHCSSTSELRTKSQSWRPTARTTRNSSRSRTGSTPAKACAAFLLSGFSDPNNALYRERMKRFAGMYMDEDPEAPNYDPAKKIIKSIWTGSKGPMMRKATTYDWVGDPVPGTFHLLHNPAGRGEAARTSRSTTRRCSPTATSTWIVSATIPEPRRHPPRPERLRAHSATKSTKHWVSRLRRRLETAHRGNRRQYPRAMSA